MPPTLKCHCAIGHAATISQALYATISSRLAQPNSGGMCGSGPWAGPTIAPIATEARRRMRCERDE